jgi:hypothetical protein
MHMRFISQSSEDEMIALFLQHELISERFGPALRKILSDESIDERIVRDPNLLNARENAIRRRILALHRGYGTSDNRYLSEFPTTGVTWSRMGLTRDDVCSIRYIDWD